MGQEYFLEMLKNLMSGFAKLLGNDTEIVIHDLYTYEMVYIVNGHVTGRSLGYKTYKTVYDAVFSQLDEEGHTVGYGSHSSRGKMLKASHFLIRNEAGEPRALICINQDTEKLKVVRDMIDAMIQIRPLEKSVAIDEADENYVQKMVRRMILDEIEKMKPTSLESKESKLTVIRQLELKGVFTVKDAVPLVCEALSISQATLYNYLKEIRSDHVSIVQNIPKL